LKRNGHGAINLVCEVALSTYLLVLQYPTCRNKLLILKRDTRECPLLIMAKARHSPL